MPLSDKKIPLLYKLFHLTVMFFEGQGYILAMFSGIVVLSNIFRIKDWMQTRKDWIKTHAKIYKLIMVVLLLAALIEVIGLKVLLVQKL